MSTQTDKHALIIANPVAGKMKAKSNIEEIKKSLRSKYNISVHLTKNKGDATKIVDSYADSQDLLVCCGGDGTFNEVVTGIMKKNIPIPLGYIPTGTTNDIARTLNLPFNTKDALEVILNGQPISHDVGIFNNNIYFNYIASFGAFTDVAYTTPQWAKNHLGYSAYILDILKNINSLKAYNVSLKVDGQEEICGKFIFGCVTNTTSIGGLIKLNNCKVELNDGKFELLLIPFPKSPANIGHIFDSLLHQRFDNKNLFFLRSDHIEFHFDTDIPWTVDGEFAGDHNIADIKVRQNAFSIIRSDNSA